MKTIRPNRWRGRDRVGFKIKNIIKIINSNLGFGIEPHCTVYAATTIRIID